MKQYYVALMFMFVSLTACAGRIDQYRTDAEAFCELHGREHWASRTEDSAIENMEYLAGKIRATVKTKEFLGVFERLSEDEPVDFYGALQAEVSKLIGGEWSCGEARDFYAINWTRAGGKPDGREINVVVSDDGSLEIDKNRFAIVDDQGIRDAIVRVSQGGNYKIFLSVPNGTTKEELNGYLEPFRRMGVKSLSVIYY